MTQRDEYSSRWAISQSAIKDWYFKSPTRWKEIWIDRQQDLDKNEDNFIFGSLVDTLLFSKDKLNDRFYVGTEELPSKAIESIIKSYYNHIVKHNKEIEEINKDIPVQEELLEYSLEIDSSSLLFYMDSYKEKDGDKAGWNIGWKLDTRLNKVKEQGKSYFESLVESSGRKVISPEMNMEAIEIVDILRKNESCKDYFVENEDNKLIFQLEIFSKYIPLTGEEIPIKGALDIVRFDHKRKTIQIADFKTSFCAFEFLKSIKQYSYCDQLSFYDNLLRNWLIEYCDGEYCNYTVIEPCNIVIDSREKVPYIYEYDWKDINLSADGNIAYLYDLYQTYDHNAKVKKGWKNILNEIGWHYTNSYWSKPKELHVNGKIKVNLLNT